MSNSRGADTPVREAEPLEQQQTYSRTTQPVSTKTEQPAPQTSAPRRR
jgi:hypothetical protein